MSLTKNCHMPQDFAGANLFLTRKCNLNCWYCFVDKSNARDLADETLDKAVEFIVACARASSKPMHVSYIGGEPLLNWDLFKSVTGRFKRLLPSLNLGFTTNGTLLTDEKLRYIAENNLRIVTSFDGDINAMHDRPIKGGKSSFYQVRKGIETLVSNGVSFNVQMTVTPTNVKNYYQNVVYLIELGVKKIIFGFGLDLNWSRKDLLTLKENLTNIFLLYRTIYRENYDIKIKYIDDEILSYLLTQSDMPRVTQACPMGKEIFAVDVDGYIYPCQALVNYQEWSIGNVWEGFDQKAVMLISSIKNDAMIPCQNCELKKFCRKCPRSNYLFKKDPYHMEKFSCFLGQTTYYLVEDFVQTLYGEDNPRLKDEIKGLVDVCKIPLS